MRLFGVIEELSNIWKCTEWNSSKQRYLYVLVWGYLGGKGGGCSYQDGYLHVVLTKLSYALVDVKTRRELLSERSVRCKPHGAHTTCRLNECYPECLQNLI